MVRVLFCFILFFIVTNFCWARDFELSSTVKIKSPSKKTTSKKIDNIITLFSKLNYSVTQKKDFLNLTLSLYDVEVRIYEGDKIISQEKYPKYFKTFVYSVKTNSLNSYEILDNNPKDLNPWSFVKPLLLLYHFKNVSTLCLVGNDSKTIFQKFDSRYTITEKMNNLTISNGKVEFKKDSIELEMETFIPKGFSKEVDFEIKSHLTAKLQKMEN
ncbi:MAG: hypothetical protein ACK4ZM_04160, partial [bacterium]